MTGASSPPPAPLTPPKKRRRSRSFPTAQVSSAICGARAGGAGWKHARFGLLDDRSAAGIGRAVAVRSRLDRPSEPTPKEFVPKPLKNSCAAARIIFAEGSFPERRARCAGKGLRRLSRQRGAGEACRGFARRVRLPGDSPTGGNSLDLRAALARRIARGGSYAFACALAVAICLRGGGAATLDATDRTTGAIRKARGTAADRFRFFPMERMSRFRGN